MNYINICCAKSKVSSEGKRLRLEVRKSYNFEIIPRKGRSIYKEQPNTTEKTARKFLASNIELFRPKRDGTLKERARLDRDRES